jgi:hypothetical protein
MQDRQTKTVTEGESEKSACIVSLFVLFDLLGRPFSLEGVMVGLRSENAKSIKLTERVCFSRTKSCSSAFVSCPLYSEIKKKREDSVSWICRGGERDYKGSAAQGSKART